MKVYTVQISVANILNLPNVIDITAASASGHARTLSPTWDMVNKVKKGKITADEYEKRYFDILNRALTMGIFEEVFPDKEATYHLACYCIPGQFCHRHLLSKYLNTHFGAIRCGEKLQYEERD